MTTEAETIDAIVQAFIDGKAAAEASADSFRQLTVAIKDCGEVLDDCTIADLVGFTPATRDDWFAASFLLLAHREHRWRMLIALHLTCWRRAWREHHR